MLSHNDIRARAVADRHPDNQGLDDPTWDAVGVLFSALTGFSRIGTFNELTGSNENQNGNVEISDGKFSNPSSAEFIFSDQGLLSLALYCAFDFTIGDQEAEDKARRRAKMSLREIRDFEQMKGLLEDNFGADDLRSQVIATKEYRPARDAEELLSFQLMISQLKAKMISGA